MFFARHKYVCIGIPSCPSVTLQVLSRKHLIQLKQDEESEYEFESQMRMDNRKRLINFDRWRAGRCALWRPECAPFAELMHCHDRTYAIKEIFESQYSRP